MHYKFNSEIDTETIRLYSSFTNTELKFFIEKFQSYIGNEFNLIKEFNSSNDSKKERLLNLMIKIREKNKQCYNNMIQNMLIELNDKGIFMDKLIQKLGHIGFKFNMDGKLVYSETGEEVKIYTDASFVQSIPHPSLDENKVIYSTLKEKALSMDFLDDIVKLYIEEACTTASVNRMLSAIVMLGCASEKLYLLFAESYYNYAKHKNYKTEHELQNVKKNCIDGIRTAEKMTKLSNYILQDTNYQNNIFKKVYCDRTQVNIELNNIFAVFHIIRISRNDAGHPTGTKLTPDEFASKCALFKEQLEKINKLIQEAKMYCLFN